MRSIRVGLIGVGPNWESRYRPALEKLKHRISVRAVFDHVFSRAESVAKSLNVLPVGGVLSLVARADIDAVLVLDAGWHGTALLDRVCSKGKPVYLSQHPADSLLSSEQLHSIAVLSGTTVMPEFEWRYQPSSSRLQELLASRLGRPTEVSLSISSRFPSDSQASNFVLEMLDWCRYLARTSPETLSAETDEVRGTGNLTVQFCRPKSGDDPLRAHLDFLNLNAEETDAGVACRVSAPSGNASFGSSDSIDWKTDEESSSETLSQDRTAVEVMLDHFCRRVAGGLIPVPDLGDVCTALRLFEAIEQGLQLRRPVEFADVM